MDKKLSVLRDFARTRRNGIGDPPIVSLPLALHSELGRLPLLLSIVFHLSEPPFSSHSSTSRHNHIMLVLLLALQLCATLNYPPLIPFDSVT